LTRRNATTIHLNEKKKKKKKRKSEVFFFFFFLLVSARTLSLVLARNFGIKKPPATANPIHVTMINARITGRRSSLTYRCVNVAEETPAELIILCVVCEETSPNPND
jgi:hypothetical protein